MKAVFIFYIKNFLRSQFRPSESPPPYVTLGEKGRLGPLLSYVFAELRSSIFNFFLLVKFRCRQLPKYVSINFILGRSYHPRKTHQRLCPPYTAPERTECIGGFFCDQMRLLIYWCTNCNIELSGDLCRNLKIPPISLNTGGSKKGPSLSPYTPSLL